METRFLETFMAVVDAGSISAAAKRLNVTAATIAQRVGVLEAEMRVPLLIRCGRVSVPTPAGTVVASRAREVVTAVRDLHVLDASDFMTGELRVGAISSAITGILPAALKRMASTHPDLNFNVVPGTSQEIYEGVLDGQLDVGLLVKPHFPLPKSCVWTPLRTEPLIVVAPQAMAGDPIELLMREPFIRYARRHPVGAIASAYLESLGIKPLDRLELDSLEAIVIMVDQGVGVSLIPDWLPPWPEGLNLRRLPLPSMAPTREIGFIRQIGLSRTQFARSLLDAIHETLSP